MTRFSTAIHKMTNLSGYVQTVVSLKYPLLPCKTQVEKLMSKMTYLESDTNRNQTSSKLFAVIVSCSKAYGIKKTNFQTS